MGGLLEVAEVTKPGGSWASGYQIDSYGCALKSYVSDICEPERELLSGAEDGETEGLDANIFAVLVSMPGRLMCTSGFEPDLVRNALDIETEKAAGRALWGITNPGSDVSLIGEGVTTVGSGDSAVASVAAALIRFWEIATGVSHTQAIVHLGILPLLELFGQVEDSRIKNLGIHVASSPGYPVDGIAITGPIKIRLSDDEVLSSVDTRINRGLSEANRLAALEFDPCLAVRVT